MSEKQPSIHLTEIRTSISPILGGLAQHDWCASIRKELSNMSFEQLLQLKEELGTKVYNEAIFGTSSMNDNNFKRANKNR
uniref:Uncharacterized protein n=1 Tax=Timema genevievae TaxID=629358 RepID=A0A7R9PK99_TIMGE|nr:unnamed protein product [Timema genevievae]